jgi:hypothetical protein
MTAHRPYERKGCLRKRRFPDRLAAQLEASRWGDLRAYRCPFCKGWHLASKVRG